MKLTVMQILRCMLFVPLASGVMTIARATDVVTPPQAPVTTPAEGHDDETTDEDADVGKPDPAKDAQRATKLATTFGVTEQQVLTMRQTDHMGWGEIRSLLLISQRVAADSKGSTTPLTIDGALTKVLAQRTSGMGIGEIAKSHNIKLGDLRHEVKPEHPGKPEMRDKPDRPEGVEHPEKPEKPERFTRPDKPDRPDRPEKPNHQ